MHSLRYYCAADLNSALRRDALRSNDPSYARMLAVPGHGAG